MRWPFNGKGLTIIAFRSVCSCSFLSFGHDCIFSFHDVVLNPRWLLRAFLVYLLKDNTIHNNNIPRVSPSSPQKLHTTLQPC